MDKSLGTLLRFCGGVGGSVIATQGGIEESERAKLVTEGHSIEFYKESIFKKTLRRWKNMPNASRNTIWVTGLTIDIVHFLTLIYPFYELNLPYRQPS